jgi:hypothetical protein
MDFNEFARTLPDWARAGIIGGCWFLGFKIGYGWLDRHLERKRLKREARMRDVTPA